jgi:hypothetical protein
MRMPEAAMDHNCYTPSGKRYIRSARHSLQLNPETIAELVEEGTHQPFGSGIGSSDPRHMRATLRRCEFVRQFYLGPIDLDLIVPEGATLPGI